MLTAARLLLVTVALLSIGAPALGRNRQTAPPEPFITAYASGAFSPDHPIVFSARGLGVQPTAFKVWLLSDDLSQLMMKRRLKRSMLPELPTEEGVPKARGTGGDYELGPLPSGSYLAEIDGPASVAAFFPFVVSSIAIVAVNGTDGVNVTAFDLITARVRRDVTFSLAEDPTATKRADAAGQARFPFAAAKAFTVVGRADDGSVARQFAYKFYGFDDRGARKYFVVTDRPIYRPGDTVDFRIIIRDTAGTRLTIPSGGLPLEFRGPRGGASIWSDRLTISTFGTVSGRVKIPTEGDLGSYELRSRDRSIANIAVAAYRKPEFTVAVDAPAHASSGDVVRVGANVRYLFGRPAAGADVSARVVYAELPRWMLNFGIASASSRDGATPASDTVTARADRNGLATLILRAPTVGHASIATINIDARDASGRTVTSRAQILVTPSDIDLQLRGDHYFSNVGVPTTFTVSTSGFDKRKLAGQRVNVHIARNLWSSGSRSSDEDSDQTVVTGKDGTARITLTPAKPGYYSLVASVRDTAGRNSQVSSSLWIHGENLPQYDFTSLSITPNRDTLAPGEPVTLLVTSPIADADVLLVTATSPDGRAEAVSVQHLVGNSGTLRVAAPAGVPDFHITATVANATGPRSADTLIHVSPQPHRLTIRIVPDRNAYRPGQIAHMRIHAEDELGRPVRAELSLGVVDDGVLALAGTDHADLYARLYGGSFAAPAIGWWQFNQPVRYLVLQHIGAATSRAGSARLVYGATADVYSLSPGTQDRASTLGGGGNLNSAWSPIASVPGVYVAPGQSGYIGAGPSFEDARTDFRDTAYWTPTIVTDAGGNATVAFRWPDSLTSFSANAVGVTVKNDIGSGTARVLVTKPYLVRLSTPRFIRSGDSATIATIAHGLRAAKTSTFRLRAPELGIDDVVRTALYDGSATASLPWTMYGGDTGSAKIELAGVSGGDHDGLRVSLPVEAAGASSHERATGMLPGTASTDLVLPSDFKAGDLKITLAPSLVASIADSVRLLDVYPYYCVEQTMSAALPAVALERARAGTSAAAGLDPATVAAHAIKRLVQLQHSDGAWGWWEHDDANPFMTAYALYGLAELSRDNYDVPADVIDRGVKAVDTEFKASTTPGLFHGPTGNIWNTRAYLLFALSDARPSAVDPNKLHSVDAHVNEMNDYGLAVLGLAHVKAGDSPGAQPILDALMLRAHANGDTLSWTDGGWHYGWVNDPVEATAYALRLLHALRPDDPRIAHVVEWLQQQRRGSWYGTTKDTAASILTMVEIAPPGELHPDETITVALDGKPVRSVRITTSILPQSSGVFSVPAAQLRHGGALTFTRSGTGSLYWSTDWTRYGGDRVKTVSDLDASQLRALGSDDPAPFTIGRTYTASHAGPWRVGDDITVDILVKATRDSEFIAIEDPLPAGVEYQPAQGEVGKNDWSGLQFFDDRVVFFAQSIGTGYPITLHYTMRVTTAGTFTAPASSAYAMYGPPVTALGKAERVTIVSAGGAP